MTLKDRSISEAIANAQSQARIGQFVIGQLVGHPDYPRICKFVRAEDGRAVILDKFDGEIEVFADGLFDLKAVTAEVRKAATRDSLQSLN